MHTLGSFSVGSKGQIKVKRFAKKNPASTWSDSNPPKAGEEKDQKSSLAPQTTAQPQTFFFSQSPVDIKDYQATKPESKLEVALKDILKLRAELTDFVDDMEVARASGDTKSIWLIKQCNEKLAEAKFTDNVLRPEVYTDYLKSIMELSAEQTETIEHLDKLQFFRRELLNYIALIPQLTNNQNLLKQVQKFNLELMDINKDILLFQQTLNKCKLKIYQHLKDWKNVINSNPVMEGEINLFIKNSGFDYLLVWTKAWNTACAIHPFNADVAFTAANKATNDYRENLGKENAAQQTAAATMAPH